METVFTGDSSHRLRHSGASEIYGYEPSVKGMVEATEGGTVTPYPDYCKDAYNLIEYFCRDKGLEGVWDSARVECGSSSQCVDGACVERSVVCQDQDGDGLQGRLSSPSPPSPCRLTTAADCNDNDPKIGPCCVDRDGDGFQNPNDPIYQRILDPGMRCKLNTQVDCNDTNDAIKPWAAEVCGNGVDDDCDGVTDEGCQKIEPCNTTQIAGGDWVDTQTFSLGKLSGSFTMTYTTYLAPDQIDVSYEGNKIWSSGCVGTGMIAWGLGIYYLNSAPCPPL